MAINDLQLLMKKALSIEKGAKYDMKCCIREVDEANYSCTVETTNTTDFDINNPNPDNFIFNVKLGILKDLTTKKYVVPSLNSLVIVRWLNNTEAYISATSEISKEFSEYYTPSGMVKSMFSENVEFICVDDAQKRKTTFTIVGNGTTMEVINTDTREIVFDNYNLETEYTYNNENGFFTFGETFNFYNEKCGKSFGNYNNDIMNILSNLVGVGSGTVAINTLYDVNLETVLPAPGTPISTQITAMKTKYKNLIF